MSSRWVISNIFSTERDYGYQILLRWILFAFRHKNKLTTLNNIGLLLKGVSIDLHARNFVHTKISLCARWAHADERERNLSSPVTHSQVFPKIEVLNSHSLLTH